MAEAMASEICAPEARASAAAHAQHDVGARAHEVVGVEEQGLEVLPGVVAAGAPALEVHEARVAGRGVGEGERLLELLDGAGLEAVLGDAGVGEAGEQ